MGTAKAVEAVQTPADDFKQIHGVGPGLEARLHAVGIRTYAQLADMTPDEVILTLGGVIGLSVKRIEDQNWIGQAKQLAPAEKSKHANGKASRQHYATFTIELLLDASNNVRRTRAFSIQNETEETWAGWDEHRLVEFVTRLSGLQPAPLSEIAAEPPAPVEPPAKKLEISGQVRLNELSFTARGGVQRGRILARFQPFVIKIELDLKELQAPENASIHYSASIIAKTLGEGLEVQLGNAEGIFEPAADNLFFIQIEGLKDDMYRLKIALDLSLSGSSTNQPHRALLDGGLLKIY